MTEVDVEFSTINFESLDSLMADLGNMITNPKKETQPLSPVTVTSPDRKLPTSPEFVLRTPEIVEPPPLSTEEYIATARKSFMGGNLAIEALKSQHTEEIIHLKVCPLSLLLFLSLTLPLSFFIFDHYLLAFLELSVEKRGQNSGRPGRSRVTV